MKKVLFNFEDGGLKVGMDLNEDNKPALELGVYPSEVFQEIFSRASEEEVKVPAVVTFKVVDGKVVMVLDTDKDGEKMLDLSVDIPELVKEIANLFEKK